MTQRSLTDATSREIPGKTRYIKIETPDTAWTSEYYGLAVEQLRRGGRRIDDEVPDPSKYPR
jgi:hypothetical protein